MTETPNPNIIDADTLTGEMRPIRRAVLALGSNLGERMASLQGAVDALADTPDVWVTAVSPVYETEPVDCPRTAPKTFLNAVVLIDTTLAATPADGPRAGHRGRLRPRAQRGPQRAAHPRRRPDRGRRPAQRRRRPPAAAPAGRTSAPSCCARGSTSTRTPSSPTAGPVADLLDAGRPERHHAARRPGPRDPVTAATRRATDPRGPATSEPEPEGTLRPTVRRPR